MILLPDFLIITDSISNYSKQDIDGGRTPSDIYTICSCIRETFCLSYSIRKENNLYFYISNNGFLIRLDGISLRFMGSDERSQALLFLKAFDKVEGINELSESRWIKSTPGIYVKKLKKRINLLQALDTLKTKDFVVIYNEIFENSPHIMDIGEELTFKTDSLYIFFIEEALFDISSFVIQNFGSKKIKLINLSRIKSIENKILFINFQIDQQEV